jgi:hypothetical protein
VLALEIKASEQDWMTRFGGARLRVDYANIAIVKRSIVNITLISDRVFAFNVKEF